MTPTIFTPIVILAGLFAGSVGSMYWQAFFCLFGAASAIQLNAIGGSTITPGPLFLPFLLARAWAENFGAGSMRRIPRAAVWLGLAVLCGALTAYYIPRAFEGDIEILTVDMSAGQQHAALYPLHPVSGNITQSGYAIGGVLAFLAFRALLERPGRVQHFRDAVLLLATLDALCAVMNLAEFHLGFPPVLDYVRNAYAVFGTYADAGGLVRIHGTFSETSAYCIFTLPLFAFCFRLWMHHVRPLYTGLVATTLLLSLLISTSTTAYVGMALYGGLLVFSLTHQAYLRGSVPRLGLLIAGALLSAVVVGSLFVLETPAGQHLTTYFDQTVFSKLQTDSGKERSEWNRHAWENFMDTYGLGVGLGSARASSLPLVLLSNLGLAGTLCFCGFVVEVFRRRQRHSHIDIVQEASSQALMASLAASVVSATVYDMGLMFYAFAAAASCSTLESRLAYAQTKAPHWLRFGPVSLEKR